MLSSWGSIKLQAACTFPLWGSQPRKKTVISAVIIIIIIIITTIVTAARSRPHLLLPAALAQCRLQRDISLQCHWTPAELELDVLDERGRTRPPPDGTTSTARPTGIQINHRQLSVATRRKRARSTIQSCISLGHCFQTRFGDAIYYI